LHTYVFWRQREGEKPERLEIDVNQECGNQKEGRNSGSSGYLFIQTCSLVWTEDSCVLRIN
jgi:hypothetical protein